MAYLIIAEEQIKRINELIKKIERIKDLPLDILQAKPTPKAWSVLEIIDHLNVSYTLYLDRINSLLPQLPDRSEATSEFQAGWINRQVINSLKPKGKKRKFKMKTMARFNPTNAQSDHSEAAANAIFADFYLKYDHLKSAIKTCRYKDCNSKKIESAIGPVVRFYLPEAFEFLLVHSERHWLQIEETLAIKLEKA